MAGGKSTPKKDKKLKVSGGQAVKKGQLLIRGVDSYKAGINVTGIGTIFALCDGIVSFSKKRDVRGRTKTYIHVKPKAS